MPRVKDHEIHTLWGTWDKQRAGGGCRRQACAVELKALPAQHWSGPLVGASLIRTWMWRDGAGLAGISRGGSPVNLGRGFGVFVRLAQCSQCCL